MPKRKESKKRFGDKGERFAIRLLEKNGYKITDINFRKSFGEIDIIAIDPSAASTRGGQAGQDDTLVFIEVKTRTSDRYGLPEEAVTKRKLRRIKKAGQAYVKLHDGLPVKKRIDVVSIIAKNGIVRSVKIINVD
jgi:putative endonuclease